MVPGFPAPAQRMLELHGLIIDQRGMLFAEYCRIGGEGSWIKYKDATNMRPDMFLVLRF